MTEPLLHRPVLLTKQHLTSGFDCGDTGLDEYLARFALADQRGDTCRTYAAVLDGRVVAFYSLAPVSASPDSAPWRIRQGQARREIGALLIARLAVDRSQQGRKLGGVMLRDALGRCLAGARIVGGRAVLVHAKDERAASFYRHFGFTPSPTDPLHLWMLMKDVRATLGG